MHGAWRAQSCSGGASRRGGCSSLWGQTGHWWGQMPLRAAEARLGGRCEPTVTLAPRLFGRGGEQAFPHEAPRGQKLVSSCSAGIWRTRWFQAAEPRPSTALGHSVNWQFPQRGLGASGAYGLQLPPLVPRAFIRKAPRVFIVISEAANVTVVISPLSGSMAGWGGCGGASHPCP